MKVLICVNTLYQANNFGINSEILRLSGEFRQY